MSRLCDINLCTGCTACTAACPHGCIDMVEDDEGFRRPKTDAERCVGCGLCTKACPVLSAPETNPIPAAYAAKNNTDAVRQLSTSGGVFTLLAEHVLAQGGVVFGAVYSADFKVEHRMAENADMLSSLRGAKYVQSDLSGVFCQIKEQLARGRKVLFSGTPCQVAGLQAFLGKDEPDLLLVDLVCHGVPSPAVWERYLRQKNEQFGGGCDPSDVNLRCKDSGWSNYSVDIRWPNGKKYLALNREDPYIRAFVGDLCLRPSCYSCSFKGLSRRADFTLGDYWGVWDQAPAMNDGRGTSIVLVHSEKAKAVWQELTPQMTLQTVDVCRCMEQNPAALQSAKYDSEKRSAFMHRYTGEDMALLVDELLPRPGAVCYLISRIIGKLKRLLKK